MNYGLASYGTQAISARKTLRARVARNWGAVDGTALFRILHARYNIIPLRLQR